jgi:hypothetical protein
VATSPQYEEAKAKVDARIGFFVHAIVFAVLNLVFLIAIGWDWLWVTLFWGVGLVMHGVATFIGGPGGLLNSYRQRAIQKEMSRDDTQPL